MHGTILHGDGQVSRFRRVCVDQCKPETAIIRPRGDAVDLRQCDVADPVLTSRQIEREKVRAVFIENMTSPRMAEMLARETGAVLGGTVYSDALSPPGGPAATYLEMLRHNTTLFAAAMHTDMALAK